MVKTVNFSPLLKSIQSHFNYLIINNLCFILIPDLTFLVSNNMYFIYNFGLINFLAHDLTISR